MSESGGVPCVIPPELRGFDRQSRTSSSDGTGKGGELGRGNLS